MNYRDTEKLRAGTEALRRLGFSGRTAIHPHQVPVINEVFTPTAEEVAEAERVIAAYAEGAVGRRRWTAPERWWTRRSPVRPGRCWSARADSNHHFVPLDGSLLH